MPNMTSPPNELTTLLEIVAKLRAPDGCPWDKVQTHQSLIQYLIEEAYEVAEVVEKNSSDLKLKEELGDVLFQVALHSQIAEERGAFSFNDVVEVLNKKMIRRHPHVFSGIAVQSKEEVLANWEVIKATEKKETPKNPYEFDISKSLPALQRARKIGDKTSRVKFDWPDAGGAWLKVQEEFEELKEALAEKNESEIFHEIGDMFFSLAQLSRHLQADPEAICREANQRFESRYKKMRELAEKDLKDFVNLEDHEKESYWQQAKKILKQKPELID